MFQSFVIDINGTFVGAALTVPAGFQFHAVHPRVGGLEGRVWDSLAELRREAGYVFVLGHLRQGDPAAEQVRTH